MTIPVGNYDVYTLATAMDALIVAEGHIAYVPLVNKFSFIKKIAVVQLKFFLIFLAIYIKY